MLNIERILYNANRCQLFYTHSSRVHYIIVPIPTYLGIGRNKIIKLPNFVKYNYIRLRYTTLKGFPIKNIKTRTTCYVLQIRWNANIQKTCRRVMLNVL